MALAARALPFSNCSLKVALLLVSLGDLFARVERDIKGEKKETKENVLEVRVFGGPAVRGGGLVGEGWISGYHVQHLQHGLVETSYGGPETYRKL